MMVAGITKRILLVVMPLLLPALGTVSLLALIMAWDEYFYALLCHQQQGGDYTTGSHCKSCSGRQSNYNLIAAEVLSLTPLFSSGYFSNVP